ncbi:MAG: hypothetical protein IIZ68_01965 [Clostridia bacterium]|nr:hypothetical protein [Clostridia bacterium]
MKEKWAAFKTFLGRLLLCLLILAAVVVIGARCYFRFPVQEYYQLSEKAFKIPDCNEGFVAQGIAYDDKTDCFFVTGYMTDGSASPIYVVSRRSGEAKRTRMLGTDGQPFACHAGGLSVTEQYVYIAGGADGCLYVYDRAAVLSAETDETIPCLGTFRTALGDGTDIGVAFTTIHDGKLYVGEFYREQNYPTAKSHKLTTSAGDYNQALAVAYEFSDAEDAVFGLSPQPVVAYSLPDLVQGMCFANRSIYLSTSYGLAFSQILIYDEGKLTPNGEIAGLPLYELDSATLTKSQKLPPMSEEIEFLPSEGKLFTMCESASNKYIFGKLTGGEWCYATK